MRILILGGNGMLSHKLFFQFRDKFDVRVTLRNSKEHYKKFDFYNDRNTYFSTDVQSFQTIEKALKDFKPEVVINGIGLTHDGRETNYIQSIEVNALLPHKVEKICGEINARFIQISTDCVFAGDRQMYAESDFADANNLYGRTKQLGEVHEKHCLTLRTSIIGLEIDHKKSLIEWFLSQKGSINGYASAIFSGVTTAELARIIEYLILKNDPKMYGVWHVSSQAISKYELLKRLQDRSIQKNLIINQDNAFKCNRSLNGDRFREYTKYKINSWDFMLDELAKEIIARG